MGRPPIWNVDGGLIGWRAATGHSPTQRIGAVIAGGTILAVPAPRSRHSSVDPPAEGSRRAHRGMIGRSASGRATRCSRGRAARSRRATSRRIARSSGQRQTDRPAADPRPRGRQANPSGWDRSHHPGSIGRSSNRSRRFRAAAPARRLSGLPMTSCRMFPSSSWAAERADRRPLAPVGRLRRHAPRRERRGGARGRGPRASRDRAGPPTPH